MKLSKNFFKQLLRNLFSFMLILLLYYIATWRTGCPIKYVLGIACPGCGMTRAWLAVARLDFSTAFAYHPLFLLSVVIVFAILFHPWINFKKWRWLGIILITLFLIVYLLRLFIFPDSVVNHDFSGGVLFKLLTLLIHLT